MKPIKKFLITVKATVGHFKRSSTATAELIEQQKRIGLDKTLFYLIIQRFVELKEVVKTTTAFIDSTNPASFSAEELKILREIVTILTTMK